MIRFQFFPRSHGITSDIQGVVDCFRAVETEIDSSRTSLTSNDVLELIRPYLEQLGFSVEKSKHKDGKIDVPVLFGENNVVDKLFYADALSRDGKIVIEIEAGWATENNQFLKDIFEACMMFDVQYLVLAIRNTYRAHNDFGRINAFLETLYISNRIKLPLSGILLIGY